MSDLGRAEQNAKSPPKELARPDRPTFDSLEARLLLDGGVGGEIHGMVWEDFAGDGAKDSSDGPLAGVTVYLDLNENGLLDAYEPQTTTGTTGLFFFRDLASGTYTVAQLLRDGYTQTSPGALTVDVAPGEPTSDTRAGEPVRFGNHPLRSEIHGRVWHDANRDGIQDADELPLEGVTVYLDLNGNGQQDPDEPARATDSDGQYSFVDLLRGAYRVIEVTPEGYLTTLAGGVAPRQELTLAPDQKATDIDFGNTATDDVPTTGLPVDPLPWYEIWALLLPGGWPDGVPLQDFGLVLIIQDDGTVHVAGDVPGANGQTPPTSANDLALDRGWLTTTLQDAFDVWDLGILDTLLTALTSLSAPGEAASLDIGDDAAVGNASIALAGNLSIPGLVNVGLGGMLSIDGLLTAEAVNIIGGVLTNSPGGAAALTVGADVALTDGATFLADAVGAGVDTLVSDGAVAIGADASLGIAVSGGGKEFVAGTYTLIAADGGLSGTFADVTDLGAYVSVNGNGLTYDQAGGTVTLTLEMGLNPGDGNFDGVTNSSDRTIWNDHYFTFDTAFAAGDYNGDGRTDVSDRIIWNTNNFTFASAAPAGPPTPIAPAGGDLDETMAAESLALRNAATVPARQDGRDRDGASEDADVVLVQSLSADPAELPDVAGSATAASELGWLANTAPLAGADNAAAADGAQLELALEVDLGSIPGE